MYIYMYDLLTKHEVTMAGYWPSSPMSVYGPKRSQGPHMSKKRSWPISSHLDQTILASKCGLLYGKENLSCGAQWVALAGNIEHSCPLM